MDLKKPLTFDEQLDQLAAHGMIITDREKAKDILKRYIIYIKWMKYYVIHSDGILKKQKYIIGRRLHMDIHFQQESI